MSKMYAIPEYVISDISKLKAALDKVEYDTDFMHFNLDVVPVFFEGDTFPIGEFRIWEGEYVFYMTQESMDSINIGYGLDSDQKDVVQ